MTSKLKTLLSTVCIILALCMLCFALVSCESGKTSETEKETVAESESKTESESAIESESATESESTTESESATESETESETEFVVNYTETVYQTADIVDRFKVIGRSTVTEDGITCDWSASGIEFNAYCKGGIAMTVINTKGEYNNATDSYFSVYVDGELTSENLKATGSESTVVVAKNLSEGFHTIKILKQNEALNNCTSIKTIKITGIISEEKPANKSLYFECMGDSIFSGYGVLKNYQGGLPDDTSALYAYAYLTAQMFDADYTLTSVSGIGFSKGYVPFTMPQIYKYINYMRSDEEYSFERVPDLVFLNLGTNDSYLNATEDQFKEGVRDLVDQIHEKYGNDVKILVASGIAGKGNIDLIAEVFEEYGGEEAGLYTYGKIRSNGDGGGSHPSKEGQANAATKIANYISSTFGWEIVNK